MGIMILIWWHKCILKYFISNVKNTPIAIVHMYSVGEYKQSVSIWF